MGNFPGITVDILEGQTTLSSGLVVSVADLPGIYSIDAAIDDATDEGVARRFLQSTSALPPHRLLLQVVDGTQLELGLRLTRELVRLGCPLMLVVTQKDELEAQGFRLDCNELSQSLGVPALCINNRAPESRGEVLASIEGAIARPSLPSAVLGEGVEKQALRSLRQTDASEQAQRRRQRTERIDAALLHPAWGPVLFLGIMTVLFSAVFFVAEPMSSTIDAGVGWLGGLLTDTLGPGLLASFLKDGVLGGAGTVITFLPQIVILTVAMELLDASGYLARGAFLMDRLLRAMGLSGRSFVPLLMGHACAIPAIGATRIVRDPRERLTAILVIPLMACSARLPTYALLIETFFSTWSTWAKGALFVGLYGSGLLSALAASLLLRKTATRGHSLPLLLEMPPYRTPQGTVLARKSVQAALRFLRDVGTTILAVSALLWVLLTVPAPGHPPLASGTDTAVSPIEMSLAAQVGKALEPLTAPLGFDWRINVGLIGSFGAREVLVSTLGVIFGLEDAGNEPESLASRLRQATGPDGSLAYSVPTGMALLAFFVLACQCMSTVAAIRRETKSWRWGLFVLAYTYAFAYGAAFVVYQVGKRLLPHLT